MISKKDFVDQMGILAAIYQRGFWEGESGDISLDVYYDRIGRIGRLPDLISAVKAILDDPDRQFMPKPGEIIKAMRSVALSNEAKDNVKRLSEPENKEGIERVKQIIGPLKGKRI